MNLSRYTSTLLLVVALSANCPAHVFEAKCPDALARLVDHRSSLRTGNVELQVEYFEGEPGVRHQGYLFAEWESAELFRGDAEGVVGRYSDGTPHPQGTGALCRLLTPDQDWKYSQGSTMAEMREIEGAPIPMLNPRCLGLTAYPPFASPQKSVLEDIRAGGPPAKFAESRQGGLLVVTAHSDRGEFRWTLDTERDGECVMVTATLADGATYECANQLERSDGRWFPSRLEYRKSAFAGGTKPYLVVDVLQVEFDRPEHPRRLSPADIGIDSGINVVLTRADGTTERNIRIWDGESLLTRDDIANGKRYKPGPIFSQNLKRNRVNNELHEAQLARAEQRPVPPGGGWQTHWEQVVRDFIRQFGLDAEQSQKAELLLKDCVRQARESIDREEGLAAELESLTSAIGALPASRSAEEYDRVYALTKRVDSLVRPILMNQLQPGLNRIPTRTQRKLAYAGLASAVTSRPGTQPASRPTMK